MGALQLVVYVHGWDAAQGRDVLVKRIEVKDIDAADRVCKAWRLQGKAACIRRERPGDARLT